MEQPISLALIYGSTREGRMCDTVARWTEREIAAHGGFTIDPIDPARLDLPLRHEAKDGPAVVDLQRRIGAADAFLVVTPEYNHSFPAALKFAIDSVGDEWGAKPVGFVSYGGVSGGLRAVEQLRLVFAELHAVSVRDSVSFANVWERFDDDGNVLEPERPRRTLGRVLVQLRWWATALKEARQRQPYGEAA